jgi:tetratricopeptide (TPR) repeat protein
LDANLRRAAERLQADPGDLRAFEALEEHHFLHGEWPDLVRLYERRLEGPDLQANPEAAARLCFRLGQVLEERCLQGDRAISWYREAARRAPRFRAPLTQLRRLYAERSAWDLVLQIAELESALPMQAFERAAFFTQMGEIWHQRMGDPAQGLAQFERALEADPEHLAALRGIAAVRAEQGESAAAAEALERVVAGTRGPDSARPLVELARLYAGALAEPGRAAELFRTALSHDPRCEEALEALCEDAARSQRWPALAELLERRYDLATGATRRLAIALEAGALQLERLRNPAGARIWYGRALELAPHDDPVILLSLAEVEKLAGQREARARWLDRAAAAAPDLVPVDVLVENAQLASERDPERALDGLRRALRREPGNARILDAVADLLGRLGRHRELAALLEQQAGEAGAPAERRTLLWRRVASLRGELGDSEAAALALERALEADPVDPAALDALARLHQDAGRFDSLRALLERGREHARGRQALELAVRLGELLLERFDDVEAAREAFQAALALDSADTRALQGLERIALQSGDDEAVIDAFEREASVTTDRGRLSFLVWELVRLRERKEEPDEALLWIERLAQVAPEDRRVLECCARLQEQLGHHEERVETLARLDVLLQGRERAANRRHQAELHEKLGDTERALACYRGALEADPEDVAALRALLGPLERSGRKAELAEAHGQLAQLVEGEERIACLGARAALLEELGDAQGALAVVERLAREVGPRPEVVASLERLLEATARYEDLAAQLEARQRSLPDGSPEAAELALRRADLLRGRLARAAEAASLYRAAADALPEEGRARALDGLEAALRSSGDSLALAELLGARAEACGDAARAGEIELERAGLLEQSEQSAEARALYERLADGGGPASDEAERRLRQLLERLGAFEALVARLEARLDAEPAAERVETLVRMAALRRDRLRDPGGAIECLERATALAPGRAGLWQGLARLYENAGRVDALARALEGELGAGPDADRERHLRSRAAELYRGPLGQPEAAIAHARRVLELDPADLAASEFLIEELARAERHEELAAVLEARLARASGEAERSPSAVEGETALRLRIASLRAGPLGDPEGAIAVLEPAAAAEREGLAAVAEPLADLYQRARRSAALMDLCQRAADVASGPLERAQWSLRRADALRAEGRLAEAAEGYRRVLADRPEDRAARTALRDLYRRLGEQEPLARLLEADLAVTAGDEELPLRLELAALLEGPLERPAEALGQLRRVLQIDPDHAEATDRALALAARLGDPEPHLALLDGALGRLRSRPQRARRLRERAELLAGRLGRPAEAATSFRLALEEDPDDPDARRGLRSALEAAGDIAGALDALEAEAAARPPEERAALYAEAADLAAARLSPAASLPWLARLRALRGDERALLARMTDVHRRMGSPPEALLAALRAELAANPPPDERAALLRESARLLEADGAIGRAVEALEQARAAAPRRGVVVELARLYARAGRIGARAETLRTLLEGTRGEERLGLRRDLAHALAEGLGQPDAAARELWAALCEGPASGLARIELLRELADRLLAAGRPDLWARATEAELAALAPEAEVTGDRCRSLHRELARRFERELARPDRALVHWRAVADDPRAPAEERREAEESLLAGLRASRSDVELARRLEAKLAREPEQPALWLELGRLCEERLHRPGRAADAYREVLEREPAERAALRGLRRVCERIGDAREVARALERELELGGAETPRETAALWRKLGEVCWRELDSTTRASRAFAAALEADPSDLLALRSLETLFEALEDWRGALDLYESEVEILADAEPERRREVWLRIGALACDRAGDPERALRGYERAAELSPLSCDDLRALAELYERTQRREAFVETFASWCDRPDAGAAAEDALRLAAALEALGRGEAARLRLEAALEHWPESRRGWEELARLRIVAGDAPGASAALERAAERCHGRAAAQHLERAAALVPDGLERAFALLERAVAADAGHAGAQAALAAVAGRLGRHAVAESAANRAQDLPDTGDLAPAVRLAACLAGARAARVLGHLDAAARLLRAALDAEPDHPEGLAELGEVLCETGDWPAARAALERRLALPAESGLRAHLCTLLGTALAGSREPEAALARFLEARELAPEMDAAHAGAAETLERLGRLGEAVLALRTFAGASPRPDERAARLLRAAELELRREGRESEAETLLRESSELDPRCGRAWRLLAGLAAGQGRVAESLDLATRGLERAAGDDPARADLAELRGAALEQRGDRADAAAAYRMAAELDPSRSATALAASRLLRAVGEWRAAAEVLTRLAERHPGTDPGGLARALLQLGRLRAGPLEDVPGAVDAYRRALDVAPDLDEASEALADLLIHLPDCWDEALERHRRLLAADPTRAASLRALIRIGAGRGAEGAVSFGCGILRAIGCATAEERREAPARVPVGADRRASLEEPLAEAVRQATQEAAREIGAALGVGAPSEAPPQADDAASRFRAAVVSEEARLAAPALVPLAPAELSAVLTLLAQLAFEVEAVSGDGNLVNDLARQLGRRAKRRVRRALEPFGPDDVAGLDVGDWRAELRALAAAVVLERDQVELRTALGAWLRGADGETEALPEEADLGPALRELPEARALLRRVVAAWTGLL